DGGAHWQKVLFKDADTGAIDVQFDPSNASVVYAALWQVRRLPWNLSSGGPGSGLYKSTDGGTTWKRLAGSGLPGGIYGRIGIAVSPVDPSRVYASIEAADGGLYRSDDAGASWTRVNSDERFRQRAWYFSHIFADPSSADTVYALNTGMFRSIDGGKTFDLLPAPHGDHHGLWIDPTNPRRMIEGNDGGATITVDGGKSWTQQDNQPTAQFYHVVAGDDGFAYRLYGTQQDNSGVAIKTYGDSGTIARTDWFEVGGETGTLIPDPRDPDIIYGDNEHTIFRYDHRANQYQDISVAPDDVSGRSAGELPHRFQWTAPLLAPREEPGVLYAGGEAVWRSADDGATWTQISGDLTRNDKSKQKASGGPIQLDITSVEYYDTVFALAASPRAKGTLWAGTDDGLVWVTQDTGKRWKKVTPPGTPEWGTVDMIDASPHDARRAYVAIDRHRMDDFRPYAFRTKDLGATWTPIAAGLPAGAYVHAVREDPKRAGLLYAATELGVFVSFDDGARWQPLQTGLPVTPVTDLVVHGDDLAISTNGRGFWVLDDVAPLRELAAGAQAIEKQRAHLFQPAVATRVYYNPFPDKRRPVGDNPPAGAVLDYWLAAEPKGDVALEIVDGSGALVRRLSSASPNRGPDQPPEWVDLVRTPDQLDKHAGAHRFAWDFRWSEPSQIPGAFYQGLPPWGPFALPGKYTVRLVVDGKPVQAQTLELVNDPRSKASRAELEASFALQIKTRQLIDTLHVTVNQLRSTRAQLATVRARLARSAELVGAIDAVARKLGPIEGALVQVKLGSSEGMLRFPSMLNERLDTFRGSLEVDRPPTHAQLDLYGELAKAVDAQVRAWKAIVAVDLPALNKRITTSNLALIDPTVPPPAPAVQAGGRAEHERDR
ncbi:MAG: glycosyl hydrolase, partial [Acidobacteriota bacterium]